MSSLHPNEEKILIGICPEMSVFLSVFERLHATINTLTRLYFNYDLHNTFTTHVPNLITVNVL